MKWLIGGLCNPYTTFILAHLRAIGKNKDIHFLQAMTTLFFLVTWILNLKNDL